VISGVKANRAFLGRAVRFLAAEQGIRQFLDIGTGLPTADNTHEVAQRIAPEAKVVYADNDPIVLVHARALLTGSAGTTSYVDADLRDTAKVLEEAGRNLDFSQPIAVILLGILQLIPDDDEPYAIVQQVLEAVRPGSFLVISHPTSDIDSEAMTEMARRLNERSAPAQMTLRSHQRISHFFDGLKLVEPGRPGESLATGPASGNRPQRRTELLRNSPEALRSVAPLAGRDQVGDVGVKLRERLIEGREAGRVGTREMRQISIGHLAMANDAGNWDVAV
jgi:SAM-dependent methyltransferase